MQTYYDLKPLCDLLHQEKLQRSEQQRLVRKVKAEREPREGSRRPGAAWSNALRPVLHGARTTGQMVARAVRGTA